MSRLTPVGDDQTLRLRELERRIAELEARPRAGIIGNPQILTTDNGPHSSTALTDFTRTVPVDAAWDYAVCLECQVFASAGTGTWTLELLVDGVPTERLFTHENTTRLWCSSRRLWQPTTGVKVCTVRADEILGAVTLTLEGAAGRTRQFWIQAVGPRST